MKETQQPKVSVIVTAYNLEPYIRQALESVLMQQTDFDYEVLVGDDASTDHTASVIREMEPLFQGKMKPVLREKNLGVMRNIMDLISRSRGEYLAFLDGDDYWIDPRKLQKQADFLDAHPDYCAHYHKNQLVDADGRVIEEKMSQYLIVGDYTLEHYNHFQLPGQTSTSMIRRSIIALLQADILRTIRYTQGDTLGALAELASGRIYCSDEIMSAYRSVMESANRRSWSTKYNRNNLFGKWFFFNMSLEMEKLGQEFGLSVCESEYRQEMMSAMLKRSREKWFRYIPLLCYMSIKEPDRQGLSEKVWKPYWRETKEIVRNKLKRKKES